MELNLSDRYIMALNVLLFAVLAYFVVLSVNDVLAYRRTPAEAAAPHAGSKVADDSSGDRTRAAYQAIVERDIFNLAPPPTAAPQVVVEDLHLTLIGVSQTTKGKPYAIIADRSGQQSVYRVGEMIPNSGKLLEVGKDRAIVDHAGKPVALELPKDDMNGAPSSIASSEGRHRLMRDDSEGAAAEQDLGEGAAADRDAADRAAADREAGDRDAGDRDELRNRLAHHRKRQ
jgi:type II secretory pathway component PulC